MEETANQSNSRPWLYKKGQSGNPSGKPKGTISLKTWVKNKIQTMSDEEREEFLEGLPKQEIWKMAEGLAQQDITSGGEVIKPQPIINVFTNNGHQQDIETDEKDKSDTRGDICLKDCEHTNILDSTKPVGQNTNTDERSVGELPPSA
jgi:hypothetical protein